MVEKAAKGLPAPQGEGVGGGVCNVCYQPRFLNTAPTPAPPLHGRGVRFAPIMDDERFGDGERFGYPLCKQPFPTAIKKEIAP